MPSPTFTSLELDLEVRDHNRLEAETLSVPLYIDTNNVGSSVEEHTPTVRE